MSRGLSVLVSACVVVLCAAAPAAAQTSAVTATGTGQARVLPQDRHSNASIAAAFEAARMASIGSAVKDAHRFALDYARDAGLTLGPVVSVSDQQSGGGFAGPGLGPGFLGPFGVGQFCGILHEPVFKRVKGRRKLVRVRKVHRCIVPRFAFTTLTVTYAAS